MGMILKQSEIIFDTCAVYKRGKEIVNQQNFYSTNQNSKKRYQTNNVDIFCAQKS